MSRHISDDGTRRAIHCDDATDGPCPAAFGEAGRHPLGPAEPFVAFARECGWTVSAGRDLCPDHTQTATTKDTAMTDTDNLDAERARQFRIVTDAADRLRTAAPHLAEDADRLVRAYRFWEEAAMENGLLFGRCERQRDDERARIANALAAIADADLVAAADVRAALTAPPE